MNLYTFQNLLAFRAIVLYSSLFNHCLYRDKVWIKLKSHSLDTVVRHRMWSLYVKSDEVDQQIVKRNWKYLFIYLLTGIDAYVGVAVPAEAAWGAAMLLLVPQLLGNTWMYHTVTGFKGCVNTLFVLCQLNFPTRKGKKPSTL